MRGLLRIRSQMRWRLGSHGLATLKYPPAVDCNCDKRRALYDRGEKRVSHHDLDNRELTSLPRGAYFHARGGNKDGDVIWVYYET